MVYGPGSASVAIDPVDSSTDSSVEKSGLAASTSDAGRVVVSTPVGTGEPGVAPGVAAVVSSPPSGLSPTTIVTGAELESSPPDGSRVFNCMVYAPSGNVTGRDQFP